jgi:predicted ATPase
VTGVGTRIEAAAAKGLTTFVGRLREMQVLKEAYEKIRSGNGQVVGIVGEAGVGKSRILLELRNGLPAGEFTYLEGRCLHYGGGMVYLPILDILRSYLSIEEGDREFVIKKKLQEKLIQLNEQFKSHIPPLQELLSLKIDDEKYPQLDHGQKMMRIFEGMRDVLVGASHDKPLVMAVEDLHWIDKTSEEFLGYLIDWIANSRILIILLYRPEYTHQWGSKSYYSKVGVNQLSAKTSAELVQVILEDGAVVPELKELIFGRASGNPLYVEELTQSLLENGSIQKKDHEYVLARKPSEILVPVTIQGIIAARIDRVEENLKRVIQVASVIGREFAFRILQSIMGVREELKSQLLNLQGLEFISKKRLFPELEYIFKHALTQEVAYSSLLQKRKKEIHAKIGAAIESLYPDRLEEYYELLAYHYGRSVNFDKAWEYLYFANQKAAKLNAMEDAKAYFDQAMQLLDNLPDTKQNRTRRLSIIIYNFDVFELLFKLKEYHEILNCYRHMLEEFETSELLSAFYALLGYCECNIIGKIDQAIQTGTNAIKLCEPLKNIDYAILAYVTLQWSYLWKAEFDRALTLKNDLVHLLKGKFNLRWYMYALTGASVTHRNRGYWNEAISEAEKAIKIGEEFSDNSMVSFAAMALSNAYLSKCDLSRALEYGEYAVDKAPTPGNKAWAQGYLAAVWCKTDEIDKGIQILSSTVQMYQAVNWTVGVVQAKSLLGEGYWLAGQYEKAKQILEESVELAGHCGSRFYLGVGYRILGEIARVTTPNQSSAHFEKSISIFEEISAENELALAYGGYGRLFKQQHRIEKAREYLRKSLKILVRLGTLIEPDKIKMELLELPES